MMLVSIILPNYNHSVFLKQRIDSILNQTYQNFELIVLDDCSTDNSRDILITLKNHPKVSHIIFNEFNSGSTFKQWQNGILLAIGDYIWIAESDDWCEKNFLSDMINLIERNHNIGIAYCGSNWVDDNGIHGKDLSIYFEDFLRSGKDEIKNKLIKYNTIQNASSVLLKSCLAKKYIDGGTKYKACGDWYLYINILNESNIIHNKNKLNYFRWYHNNTSNNAAKNGTWVTEGFNILKFSNAYEQYYTLKDINSLFFFWKNKFSQANSGKLKFYVKLFNSIGFFLIKTLYFRLPKCRKKQSIVTKSSFQTIDYV